LGITHCALQGVLNRTQVTLHIWLRMHIVDGSALVKGFAFAEEIAQVLDDIHLMQPEDLDAFTYNIYLRSSPSRSSGGGESPQVYKLSVSRTNNRTRDLVLLIHGALTLSPQDLRNPEFELRAEGFPYFCYFLAGAQQTYHHHSRKVLLPSAMAKKSVFLMSPFFGQPASSYVSNLVWHIRWHQALGVDRHMLYVVEQMTALVMDPRVQDLVAKGRLQLVLWDALAHHENERFRRQKQDLYAHQVIIYNHGVLANWLGSTVVAVADVDEFLMTPRPGMTVQQVMQECGAAAPPDQPLAVLQVRRYDAYCTSKPAGCGQEAGGDSELWHQVPGADKGLQHPLQHYAIPRTWQFKTADQKALVRPAYAAGHHIHYGLQMAGASKLEADVGCVRWVHVVNMHKRRVADIPALQLQSERGRWWWPVDGGRKARSRMSRVLIE